MKTLETVGLSPTERLERNLFELSDVYRKHREYIKVKYNVSSLEMEIIQLIILEGKKKMKEIGEYFRIKLSTLTSIIDKIEKQKYVKRVNSKEDRRVVYLDITPKGEKLYGEFSEYIHVMYDMMQQSMAAEDFDAFYAGLDKISELVLPDDAQEEA